MKVTFDIKVKEETEEDRVVRWKTDDNGGCSRDCPCRDPKPVIQTDSDEIGFCIILQRTLAVKRPCPVLRLRWALGIDDLWDKIGEEK